MYLRRVVICPRSHLEDLLTGRQAVEHPLQRESAVLGLDVFDLMVQVDRPRAPHEIPERIALIEGALARIPREKAPGTWAFLTARLATSLLRSSTTDPEERIDHAIAYLRTLLTEDERGRSPQGWADAQINLAHAYLRRGSGDPAENFRQTAAAASAALEVYTEEANLERHTQASNLCLRASYLVARPHQ
jgi:hypothetical protein